MSNKLKARLAAGKAAVNGWLAIPSGFSAEVMAQCGWDSVTVDMQHGVQDYQSMVQCFQAMQAHPVTPLVRVPWNEPGIIGKCLDGGAFSITDSSGPAILGAPGKIVGSSLEGSNVDIADEFTKLIVTQQAYSANTRVVTTSNQMVQDVLNMLR